MEETKLTTFPSKETTTTQCWLIKIRIT